MTLDTKIRQRFAELLEEAEKILRQNGWPGKDNFRHPDTLDYTRFRTEALNLTRRACGETSDHYKELRALAEDKATSLNSYYFTNCFGILQAAQRDYLAGMVFDVRSLVAAELFVSWWVPRSCGFVGRRDPRRWPSKVGCPTLSNHSREDNA